MPSNAKGTGLFTARCYCGRTHINFSQAPQTVAYCHCTDCRRWTGAPVAAFAAFGCADMQVSPPLGAAKSHAAGVERWNCPDCGSPLLAQFDYLPNQIYIPLGILDQAANLPPELHCYTDAQLPWLYIHDDLPRQRETARGQLSEAAP